MQGEAITLGCCFCFVSYSSVCALYDIEVNVCYCLPRYDYSTTTSRQFRAFLEDYTHLDGGVVDARKDFKRYENGEEASFIPCQGFRFKGLSDRLFTY